MDKELFIEVENEYQPFSLTHPKWPDKVLVNVSEISFICPTIRNGRDSTLISFKHEVLVNNSGDTVKIRYLICPVSYEKFKKRFAKAIEEVKEKSNRFELMDLS